jgi:glycerol uptake facilitator-like aquaporin
MTGDLLRRFVSESVGTGFLVATVVGSGIMGEHLSGGNVAIALLANTLATGAALVALILAFGPSSGAHLNPAVTLADAIEHGVSWLVAACYIPAQCIGAICGAIAAHPCLACPQFPCPMLCPVFWPKNGLPNRQCAVFVVLSI